MGLTAAARRHAAKIQWISVAVMVVALSVAARALPLDRGIAALQAWVEGFGAWGPVVYGGVYIVLALLFVPGSAITIAAGALFGLAIGTLTVSLASTIAATLAFLIARYLARDAIASRARRYPRFGAIDRAISEGGARIVALLRLSPAVPFSLGNYLFGLTGIHLLGYVVASWVFMLPGTFMFVYFGFAGARGLKAAGGNVEGASTLEWIALAIGLLATVVVTVYVTKLARKKIAEQTDIERATAGAPDGASAATPAATGWPWRATAFAMIAVVLLVGALWACVNEERLGGLFGPPRVRMAEAYETREKGARFDHSTFDALLGQHVDQRGLVDYRALGRDRNRLQAYLDAIAEAPFGAMGRDEKLALLINAYNAFTLELILENLPVGSITDIPGNWTTARWKIAGRELSLHQIEHDEIRPKFAEPRIHFALVCAAIGCPKLRAEAFVAERLDEQLEDQTRWCHGQDRWLVYDATRRVAKLTKLYEWYRGDFEQAAGSVLGFVRRYAPRIDADLRADQDIEIRYLPYDWSLNSQANADRLESTGR